MSHVSIQSGCWLWTGARDRAGYGRISVRGENRTAHTVAYELFVGPMPRAKQLDHLCRVRHCVNPIHLEPVTQRENILRGVGMGARNAIKTKCPRGHEYDRVLPNGHRRCVRCDRVSARKAQRRYKARKHASV